MSRDVSPMMSLIIYPLHSLHSTQPIVL